MGKQLPIEHQERINIISIPDTKNNPVATQVLARLFKFGKIHVCTKHGLDGCQVCTKGGGDFEDLDLKQLTSKDVLVIDS